MNFILDISVILLIILSAIKGYKKGFFVSVINFIGFVAAITISVFVTNLSSNIIYDVFIKPSIVNNINSAIYSNFSGLPSAQAHKALDSMPKVFSDLFLKNGHSISEIELALKDKSATAANEISDLFKPAIVHFLSSILFFVFIILFFFLLKFILKYCKITKVPVLGKFDSLLGGAVGFFRGVIISIIILNVLIFILPIFMPDAFSKDALNDTYVAKCMVGATADIFS